MEKAGVIYILTNPSFPEYVKIGYADDVNKRLAQLNRTECTPFAFRLYATYNVPDRLADKKLHSLLDMFDANLRAVDELNGKKRVKEFYAMKPEKAYHALELIAELTDTTDGLVLYEISSKDKNEDELANSIRRPKFNFSEGTVCAIIEAIKKGGIDSRRIACNEQLPDPKDIVFYEIALANEDSFLVTGNTKHFPKKPFVVTPAEMLQIIREMASPKQSLLSEPCARYGKK